MILRRRDGETHGAVYILFERGWRELRRFDENWRELGDGREFETWEQFLAWVRIQSAFEYMADDALWDEGL